MNNIFTMISSTYTYIAHILLFFLVPGLLYADRIVFTDGRILDNIKIVSMTDIHYLIRNKKGELEKIPNSMVKQGYAIPLPAPVKKQKRKQATKKSYQVNLSPLQKAILLPGWGHRSINRAEKGNKYTLLAGLSALSYFWHSVKYYNYKSIYDDNDLINAVLLSNIRAPGTTPEEAFAVTMAGVLLQDKVYSSRKKRSLGPRYIGQVSLLGLIIVWGMNILDIANLTGRKIPGLGRLTFQPFVNINAGQNESVFSLALEFRL